MKLKLPAVCSGTINSGIYMNIKKALKAGDKDFFFDCTEVALRSSTFINLIAQSAKMIKESGQRLVVKATAETVKMLKESNLNKFVDIIETT